MLLPVLLLWTSGCAAPGPDPQPGDRGSGSPPSLDPVEPTEELPDAEEVPFDPVAWAAPLWDVEALPVFSLTFAEEDWERAMRELIPDDECDERPYLRGDLVFLNQVTGKEEAITNVGVRYRGHSALDAPNNSGDTRWGFKLSFEAFVDDRRFHGAERLSLLGTEGDGSLLRERVVLEQMRAAGVPAPRANHAWVVVNGEPLGVFPLVEEPDDRAFLDTHFGDDLGHLYKVGGYCRGTDLSYEGEDIDRYRGFEARGQTLDTDKASDLVPMLACLENVDDVAFRACIEPWIDVDEWLSEIALDMLVGNVDGMAATGQNFLLQRPLDGKFIVYPYDLDLAFYPSRATLLGTTIFDLRPAWEPSLPVLPRRLREAYAPEFCARVLSLADDPGEEGWEAHIEAVAEQIDAAMQEDPFLSHSEWRGDVDRLVDTMRERHDIASDEADACKPPVAL